MSSVIEESEPDSSFKETVKNKMQRPLSPVPTQVDELPPDREDEISDDDCQGVDVNIAHTFVGRPQNQGQSDQADMSKLNSVEEIRQYLETELGDKLFCEVYPLIKTFGDDILSQDNIKPLK